MKDITITQTISIQRVQDLLCDAFEGGSNYWCRIEKYNYPDNETKESLKIEFPHIELPFREGSLILKDISGEGDEKKDYILNLPAIIEGLQIMADKESRHFADFLSENYDSITADVFLQCCVFKEVIYG